jgi:PAS domain S-box-containing protein
MHNLLKKQMVRIGVKENSVPTWDQWREFINCIDRSYTEADQDRYLIERSMEISSREMRQLNEKLEYAQHLAHLGYWQYDRDTKKMMWSKEMYTIFGVSETDSIPAYQELMNCANKNDKDVIKELIESSINKGLDFEFQTQIHTFDGKKKWCYFSGKPTIVPGEKTVKTITGIANDITSRINTEVEIDQYQQFLTSARRAGMLEVAVSVLHNIGNILNSINISVEFLQESFHKSEIKNIIKAIKLLNENLGELELYLTEDKKGKLLPEYFIQVEQILKKWDIKIINELLSLKDNITHLKDIVALQGTISGISGVIEKISINEILDLAFNINNQSLNKYNIMVEKNYHDCLNIESDKNKIIQILVNLIQNSKESLLLVPLNQDKKIILNTRLKDDNVEIEVRDNGTGIAPENLKHIFTFGFTTKTTGHGFGLHSSYLLAKELGGELLVESKGHNRGASFILRLPLQNIKKRTNYG